MKRTSVGLVFFNIEQELCTNPKYRGTPWLQNNWSPVMTCWDISYLHRLHRPIGFNLKETLNDCFVWVFLQNVVKILWYSPKNKLLLANSSALVASVGLNMLYLTSQITCPSRILLRLACLLGFITWVLPLYMYPSIFCCPYCSYLSLLACSLYERF